MAVNLNPTNITDLRDTCRQYRGNLGTINVSSMRDFSDLFNLPEFQAWSNNDFNGIENWDLSGAQSFAYMFYGCTNFNRNITLNNKRSGFSYYVNCESMFEGCSSLVTITSKISATVQGPTNNTSRMFYGCRSLTTISGYIKLYTQGGNNNCESMFEGCSSLNITSSNLVINNSGGSTNARRLFYGCSSLVDMRISSCTFTNIEGMFQGCTSLTYVSIGFSPSYEISASYAFYGCRSLTSLSLNNPSIFTDTSYMFYGCSSLNANLNNLKLQSNTNCESMFEGCSSLNKPLDSYVLISCLNYNKMFKDCTSYDQDLSSWILKPGSTYTDMFTNCPIQTQHKPYPLNGTTLFKPTTREELKQYCDDINNNLTLVDTSLITDMSYLFENSTRPESDIYKIINWDLSNVTTIRGMFKGCTSYTFYYNNLYYLDFINYPNVEDASELFMDCTNNIFYFGVTSRKVNFPKLKNASSMYENNVNNYCYSYNFYTDSLEHMDKIFKNTRFNGNVFSFSNYRSYGCWNLPNLISMDEAFSNCNEWTSSNPYFFDASNVNLNDSIFLNTNLTYPAWWMTTTIPTDLTAEIGVETTIDMNPWLSQQYSNSSFRLECSDPDVTLNYVSKNVYKILCNVSKSIRLIMVYNTYGKLGFNLNVINYNFDYTTDIKTGFVKRIDLTNLNPGFRITDIRFENIQQGLTIQDVGGLVYDINTDSDGTFTADIIVNNRYNGLLTVNSTKLIQDFTIDSKNSITTRKDFNTEYSGYDVTSMTITSNSNDLDVTKISDGIFDITPLNEGTFTATISLNSIESTITVNSASGITDLSYTYRATEKKNINFIDLFGSDINYDDLSITSSDPNFVVIQVNNHTYDLAGLISGSFTAEMSLNNEIKTISFNTTKLLSDENRNIVSNTEYLFNFNDLFPNSIINTSDITCTSSDVSITKISDNNFKLIANNIGNYTCIININGEESNLFLNVSKLIEDKTIFVYNKMYRINFNTLFPGAVLTGMVIKPVINNSKIEIDVIGNNIYNFSFLERGTYSISITLGNVVSTYTFKVFFIDASTPDIYQYPETFINDLIKPELYDQNLYIYQYNQYGEIEWINKYFSYMNDKMKKYLDYVYLWFVLKTNQDLSNYDMTFINDNETYFYLNFIERYFDTIYKSFGSSSTAIFWDGSYKWNEQDVKWDTSINVSNLSINKFKAFLRYIKDINNKTFNIIRFVQFCNEFVNADLENENERVTVFVDETSFDDLINVVIYATKTNSDVSILDSIIRSAYRPLMPMNDIIIRQKDLP